MLAFVTAIRHPNNTNNIQRVEELFEVTLQSMCSQLDAAFRVIVVCNELPKIRFSDPRVHYHKVTFPAPCAPGMPVSDIEVAIRDKGTRILSGILLARQF